MSVIKTSQYIAIGATLLITVLICGTLGYMVIENWGFLDALYMTIVTVTTVGFAETHPLSVIGRVFTIILIFGGWTTFAIVGALIARMVIHKEIKGFFRRNNMQNIIDKMKNHYIVCGGGRIGSFICEDLKEKKIPFVLAEIDETLLQIAEKKGYLVVKGNATTDEILLESGIKRAKGIVAALTNDADNLMISLAARELNPDIHIIARCEKASIHKRMRQGGSDVVVSPLQLGARHIAGLIARNEET
jgi:voltage-gated potassium channel